MRRASSDPRTLAASAAPDFVPLEPGRTVGWRTALVPGHWMWTGVVPKGGVPVAYVAGRKRSVAPYLKERAGERLPDGARGWVRLCGEPGCVRPDCYIAAYPGENAIAAASRILSAKQGVTP